MPSWFDASEHPVHRMRLPAAYSFEELDLQLAALTRYYRLRVREQPEEPFVFVVDVSQVPRSHARNRARIALAFEELEGLIGELCLAQAFIVRNRMLIASMNAVFWLRRPSWPTRVLTDAAEAEAWVRRHLPRE